MTPDQIARAKARADKFEAVDDPRFADPPTVTYVAQVLNALGFDAGPVDGVAPESAPAAPSRRIRKAAAGPSTAR